MFALLNGTQRVLSPPPSPPKKKILYLVVSIKCIRHYVFPQTGKISIQDFKITPN